MMTIWQRSILIAVSDADLNQHYLEEVWKRTDLFDIHVMKKWTKRDEELKTWEYSRDFFEAKMKEIDDYVAEGGATENYANANAVSEIQQKLEIIRMRWIVLILHPAN